MAYVHNLGEAEASDDDSVSLTSTVPSFHDDDEVYWIEDIVAERKFDHCEKEYFVSWKEYPESENSWIPRENFQYEEIFDDWQAQKMRISRGEEPAFDVRAWEKRKEELEEATKSRRRRRAWKKRRLNEELNDLSSESGNEARLALRQPQATQKRPTLCRESSTFSYKEEPEQVIWTEDEQRTLTKVLQEANGNTWPEILDLYRSHGATGRECKNRSVQDIKKKATELGNEFIDAGREPPEWLKLKNIAKAKKPGRSKAQSRDSSRASRAKRRDSSASVDSLLKEIKNTSKAKKPDRSKSKSRNSDSNPRSKRRDSTASVDSLLEKFKQKSSKKAKAVPQEATTLNEETAIEQPWTPNFPRAPSSKDRSVAVDALGSAASRLNEVSAALGSALDPASSKPVAKQPGPRSAENRSKKVNTNNETAASSNSEPTLKKTPRAQPLRKNISGMVRPADSPTMVPSRSPSSERTTKQTATLGSESASMKPMSGESVHRNVSGTVRPADTAIWATSVSTSIRAAYKGSERAKIPVADSSRPSSTPSDPVKSKRAKPTADDSRRSDSIGPDPDKNTPVKSPVTSTSRNQSARSGPVPSGLNISPVKGSSPAPQARPGIIKTGHTKPPFAEESRTNDTQLETLGFKPAKSAAEDSAHFQAAQSAPSKNCSTRSPVEAPSRHPAPSGPINGGPAILPLGDPLRLQTVRMGSPQSVHPNSLEKERIRSPTKASPQPNPARSGVPGSVPARSSASKAKDSAPRKPVPGGIKMTVNRSAVVKPRGPEGTLKAKVNAEQSGKRWKISVQNRVRRYAQKEPAPNPDDMVFLDPKTGKSLRTSSKTPTVGVVSIEASEKALLQLPQKACTDREAEDHTAKEVESLFIDEDAMIIDPPEVANSTRPILPLQKDKEIIPASTTSLDKREMTSAPRLYADPSQVKALSIESSGPPVNAPIGPRLSINHYAPSTHSSVNDDLVAPQDTALIRDNPSKFTLVANPTNQQKHQMYQTTDSTLVIGNLWLGAEVGPEIGPKQDLLNVKFMGMDRATHKELLKIKVPPKTMHFDFRQTCLASEYLSFYPASSLDYFGNGFICPYPDATAALEVLAGVLASTLRGCIFFSPFFTMIMYPIGSTAWSALETQFQKLPDGALLRFAVRKPLPIDTADTHPALSQLASSNAGRFEEIVNHVKANPIANDEPNVSVVFRDMFEIEYGHLIAHTAPQKIDPVNVFFLCFIPQGCEHYELNPAKRMALRERVSKEHDLFIEFLEANGAKEIYSMQDIGSIEVANNGAWDYFCKNVRSGTVIFHDSCIRVDQFPNLARLLKNGAINVWRTSLSPMDEAEKHPHLFRLFPHGGVILLTESLILYRPREALRIIMWFRRIHLPSKQSGTWKLAARPRLREWLLDLLDLYEDTGKDVFGHGKQIIADIYTEVLWLLENPKQPLTYFVCDFDSELPTDQAPLVTSSSLKALQARKEWKGDTPETTEPDYHNIGQNDDLLIQWFAEWAIVHLDSFRKLHAVLGYHPYDEVGKKSIKEYENCWGHIEVLDAEDCFKRHAVTSQDDLDKLESERRRKLRENAPRIKAEAQRARAEERQAAKAALETRMRVYRDCGASEDEVLEAGRQWLRDMGGSIKEIRDCQVDMEKVFELWGPVDGQRGTGGSGEEVGQGRRTSLETGALDESGSSPMNTS